MGEARLQNLQHSRETKKGPAPSETGADPGYLAGSGTPEPGSCVLELHDVLGLKSLGTLGHVELNAIALIERLEARSLDGAVMHENIVSGGTADETITFFVVKPLYCSFFSHISS